MERQSEDGHPQQEEGLQKKPNLLTPSSWTSSLSGCERGNSAIQH